MLALVLTAAMASACSGPASPTAEPPFESPIATPAAQGTADATFSSPLFVSPLASAPTLEPVPTPSAPDKGTVTGVLILAGNPARPMPGAILYLGEVIKLDDGRPAMSGLDKSAAPSAQTNAAGQFIFRNVPPGDYTLVFDLVVHSFVLGHPSGGDLIINAVGGQITDLGELRYYDLPGAVGPVPGD